MIGPSKDTWSELDAAHLAMIVQSSADAIFSATFDGTILSWNPGAEAMFGYTAAEMVGQSVSQLAPQGDAAEQAEIIARLRAGDAVRGLERTRVRKDGTTVPVSLTLSPLRDCAGDLIGISAILRDITDSKALTEALEQRAFYDRLTGLANRNLVSDRLTHALHAAWRGQRAPSVISLDLDGFKAVNDALGHAVGDEVLVEVAARLRAAVRPMDTVARLGGDEFVLLVEGAHDGAAVGVAQRVLESLRTPAEAHGHRVLVGASVGIAQGQAGDEADELLSNAEAAMYEAKARGKGHQVIFAPEMHTAVLQRVKLGAELAGAARRGEIILAYQPMVELATGRMVGVEALVRWQHPELGLIPPLEFISIAEDTGQILTLGNHILRQALRDLSQWPGGDAGCLYVSVNVSPAQFRHPRFVEEVAAAVKAAGVNHQRLVLEITETGLMANVDENIATLTELRASGVRIAIDDFGTGYSSIAYLKDLPVDIVKIDKSLVDGVATDPAVWALAQAIVSLIASVGLERVAEGIEDAAQVAHLEALGFGRGQGYYYARPIDAAVVASIIDRSAPLPDRWGSHEDHPCSEALGAPTKDYDNA